MFKESKVITKLTKILSCEGFQSYTCHNFNKWSIYDLIMLQGLIWKNGLNVSIKNKSNNKRTVVISKES